MAGLHERIDSEIEAAKREEREAIVEFLRTRIGFWDSNSNIDKKIKRLADDVEQMVHYRIQNDKEEDES